MNGAPVLALVVVYVSDLAASVRFYSAIGLQFQEERHGGGPMHFSTTLPAGTVFELYPRGKWEASRNRLGFSVPDIPAVVAAIEAVKPGCVLTRSDGEHGPVVVVEDPDGNRVEIGSTS